MHKGIIVGIAVAVAAVSFYGGMRYERSSLTASVGGQRQFALGGGRRGGMGGQFGQGGVAAGQIISHDANGITVQLTDGSSKIVFVPASAKISKSVTGPGADLVAGQYVFVTGTPNADGSVTAESVQLRPAPPSPSPSPSASTR